MNELDELGKVSAMFNAMPAAQSPLDYASQIKSILDAGEYRIFEDN
jgi:hypothetical protein